MRQHEITLHSIRTSQAWRRCSPKKVVSAYLKHVFLKRQLLFPLCRWSSSPCLQAQQIRELIIIRYTPFVFSLDMNRILCKKFSHGFRIKKKELMELLFCIDSINLSHPAGEYRILRSDRVLPNLSQSGRSI